MSTLREAATTTAPPVRVRTSPAPGTPAAPVPPLGPAAAPAPATHPGAPWLPPGRMVDLAGRGTTFIRELAGPAGAPTIVLLHGLGATADLNWFSAYAALGARFRVVAIDHRGHGRGIQSEDRFTLEDAADDAVAVLDALGIDQAIAVGYSMGGPIAQLMWRRHPGRVSGLVLCATSCGFAENPLEHAMFAALPLVEWAVRAAPTVARWLLNHARPAEVLAPRLHGWARDEVSRMNPAAVVEAAAALGRFRSEGWIGSVDVPASVLIHLRDHVVPTRRQNALADAIGDAKVVVVDADHLAPVCDQRRFVPALVRAIDAVADTLNAAAPVRPRHLRLA